MDFGGRDGLGHMLTYKGQGEAVPSSKIAAYMAFVQVEMKGLKQARCK